MNPTVSPLTLLWFISQSWFGSEEKNSCQLKPNEMFSSHLQAYSPHQTRVNLNQTAKYMKHIHAQHYLTEQICSIAQTANTQWLFNSVQFSAEEAIAFRLELTHGRLVNS